MSKMFLKENKVNKKLETNISDRGGEISYKDDTDTAERWDKNEHAESVKSFFPCCSKGRSGKAVPPPEMNQ